MDDVKPKRKYLMTPEHRAKVIASLEKARLVPKEVRYRRNEKRYQANLKNLGIAKAKYREKAEQELQNVRTKMESTFPPGDVGSGQNPEVGSRQTAEGSRADERCPASFSATPEPPIRTPALLRTPNPESRLFCESPAPSPESRFFGAGAGYTAGGPAPAHGAGTEAARGRAHHAGADGGAGALREPRTLKPGPSRPHVLPLPATEEEFRQLLVRALDLEGHAGLAQTLSEAIWERLGAWHARHEEETGNLNRFFQTPLPDDAGERDRQLRERGETLPAILDLPTGFQERLTDLTWKVNQELDQWLAIVKARDEAGARPGSAPRKPPVGVDSSEAGGSTGESEVA